MPILTTQTYLQTEFPSVWRKPSNLVSSRSVSYLCSWFISKLPIDMVKLYKEEGKRGQLLTNRLIISFWNNEYASLSDFDLNTHVSPIPADRIVAVTFIQGIRLFSMFLSANPMTGPKPTCVSWSPNTFWLPWSLTHSHLLPLKLLIFRNRSQTL